MVRNERKVGTMKKKTDAEIQEICRATRIEGLSFLDGQHLDALELALNALDLEREEVPVSERKTVGICRDNLLAAIEEAR
jgi:hypothetical protein